MLRYFLSPAKNAIRTPGRQSPLRFQYTIFPSLSQDKAGAAPISILLRRSARLVCFESAKKVPDKFEKAGFHATKSEYVNAPLIDELPMALECKVKSFEKGILIGEIVNINADESILTDGRIDPAKLKPICYDPVNNDYLVLGEKVGNAFKDGLKLK